MSEINKLYENAGVKSFKTCEFCTQRSVDCLKENISNITCGFSSDIYPPFTPEKQLELIKWLSSKYGIYIVDKYSIGFGTCIGDFCIKENFEEALAESINRLWQDLTEEEKEALRGILRA